MLSFTVGGSINGVTERNFYYQLLASSLQQHL